MNVCEVCRTAYVLEPPGAFGCQCGKYAPGRGEKPARRYRPPWPDAEDFGDPAPLGRAADWLPDAPDR